MRSLHALFIVAIATLSSPAHAQTPPANGSRHVYAQGRNTDDYVPGRVMLKVKEEHRAICQPGGLQHPHWELATEGIGLARVQRAFPHAQVPSERKNKLGQNYVDLTRSFQVDFDPAADVYAVADRLAATGLFEYVEPAYVYQTLYTPDDPFVPSQYHLPLIQAFDAWDISKGDTSVVIGIIDTGTSFAHSDFTGKHAFNYADTIDGLDNDNDGYVDNFRGWDTAGDDWYSPGDNDPTFCCTASATDHGVIVAGPAAATTDNGNLGAAVGFNCRQLAVKTSIDESPTIYNGYQGVVYAADHGAHILNLSWGGTTRSRFGEDAIQYALVNREVMVVAACGNTPVDVAFFPASFDGVISCAGTQTADAFWYSNANFGSTFHYLVDVCAPARDVPTNSFTNGYGNFTGTSLAAPIACGVGGLVKAHFPSLTMAQVAQRVRISCDQNIYTINNASYAEKMGRGRVNAYRALTDNSPAVRILAVEYDDHNDGLIQVGDTVDVRVRFVNYLDPATNLDIQLSTPDWGAFELLHTDAHVGDLGTLDTASTWLAPYRLVIRTGTAAGFRGHLRFAYTANGYDDWEYYPLTVQPNHVHVDLNRIETSMTGTGRFGYTSFPSLSTGKGMILDGLGGMMKDAGFLIGKDATHVSNCFENSGTNSSDNHFTNLQPIRRETPGPIAPLQARTVYSDAGAGANAIGVTVDQRTYQWNHQPHNNYYIQEYRIANPSASTLTGLYAGMYMDLEMFWRSNNVVKYDTVSRAIYTYTEEWVSLWDFGAALLTPDSLRGYAIHEDSFPYTIAAKFAALSSPPQAAFQSNKKLIQFIGAGPFDISPGDTHIVAFAVMLGDSLSHMRDVVAEAHDRYWCLVRGGMGQRVELGPDIRDCSGNTSTLLDAGPGFSAYAWTGPGGTGTSQSYTANQDGDYWVRVTDASGCTDDDDIHVIHTPAFNGGFTCSPASILVGDSVTFLDTTLHAIEWGWNFGDGSNLCPITQQVKHAFTQYGTYQVTLYVGNGTCIDTVVKTLVVDTLVGVANPLAGSLEVWPVPSTGLVKFRVGDGESAGSVLLLQDALGRELRRIRLAPGVQEGAIDLGGMANGVYFLSVQGTEGRQTKRLLKE